MSRKDAAVLASRALALLFIVWALVDVSHLPEYLHSFLHYVDENPVPTTFIEYRRHYYLIALGFLLLGSSVSLSWRCGFTEAARKSRSYSRPPCRAKILYRTDLQRLLGGLIR
jgi:hypothetical protein